MDYFSNGSFENIEEMELLILKSLHSEEGIHRLAEEKYIIERSEEEIRNTDRENYRQDEAEMIENIRDSVISGFFIDNDLLKNLSEMKSAEGKMLYALSLINRNSPDTSTRFCKALDAIAEACLAEPDNLRFRSIFEAVSGVFNEYLSTGIRQAGQNIDSLKRSKRELERISDKLL